jgi:hypothetical protein
MCVSPLGHAPKPHSRPTDDLHGVVMYQRQPRWRRLPALAEPPPCGPMHISAPGCVNQARLHARLPSVRAQTFRVRVQLHRWPAPAFSNRPDVEPQGATVGRKV